MQRCVIRSLSRYSFCKNTIASTTATFHDRHFAFRQIQQVNNFASTIDLDNGQLGMLKSKLIEKLKLSTQQANFVALKCHNEGDTKSESESDIDEKIELVQRHFVREDILHNLSVFSLSLNELNNRINIFLELGFERIEIKFLYNLPYLMSKTVTDLRKHRFYSATRNPCLHLIQTLNTNGLFRITADEIFTDAEGSSMIAKVDHLTLSELRSKCFVLILCRLLNCSMHVATHCGQNVNFRRNFDQTSFISLVTNLNFFLHVVKLSINQIVKYFAQFVNHDSKNLIKLAEIKQLIENDNLRQTFFTRQRLLQIEPKQIRERIDLLLGKRRCTIQQLNNCITILELTVEQIEENFAKCERCGEPLKSYANKPDYLRLILNVDLVLNNISKLENRSIKVNHLSLHNLLKSNSKFVHMVNNNNFHLTLNSFTQLHFDSSLKEIKSRIGWHKKGSQTLNLVNAENFVAYFRAQNLSDLQILNGLYLMYFDLETLKIAWEELLNSDEIHRSTVVTDWRGHPFVLQLLYYFMERTHRL